MFKLYYKFIIVTGLLVFYFGCSFSQSTIYSNQPTITIPNTQLTNCTTSARDEIFVMPPASGVTSITPTTVSSCTDVILNIDQNIICPVNYQTAINPDDPSSNPFNTNSSTPVGTTAGTFDVSPQSGAANYTVPIIVPPGTNNMAPNISVQYSSLAGNGLLGYGWSLSSLSAITRVGQNLYDDYSSTTVDFSSNDKFTLDGIRLVCVSGTYGVSGAEYRTEKETFSKIIANSDNSFTVYTKKGMIIRYGYTGITIVK